MCSLACRRFVIVYSIWGQENMRYWSQLLTLDDSLILCGFLHGNNEVNLLMATINFSGIMVSFSMGEPVKEYVKLKTVIIATTSFTTFPSIIYYSIDLCWIGRIRAIVQLSKSWQTTKQDNSIFKIYFGIHIIKFGHLP